MILKCVLLLIMGMFGSFCLNAWNNLEKGSRIGDFCGYVGYIVTIEFFILIVWSFWLMPWWVPIVLLLLWLVTGRLPYIFHPNFIIPLAPWIAIISSTAAIWIYVSETFL